MGGSDERSRAGSEWRRKMSNCRRVVGNMMGGLRGGSNAVAWAVAASLAYYLWVKPSLDLKRQQQERIAAAAAASSAQTQPQETGIVLGDTTNKPTDS